VHEDVVADQDGEVVSPAVVDGRAPAADVRLVDDVVVDEGGGVDELHHRRVDHVAEAVVAEHLRHEQEQGRAEALPPAAEDVLPDVVDGGDLRAEIAAQLLFDHLELRGDQVEETLSVSRLPVESARCHGAQG
jgi:hypothetical protein